MFRRPFWLVGLVLALFPGPVFADWIFTPQFGTTFGADTHGREHATFGGAVALFDEDAFGWEAEVSFTPDFFRGVYNGNNFLDSNSSVFSVMGNAIVSAPSSGGRVRPYATVGAGFLQIHVESPVQTGFFKTTVYEPAFNLGGGILAFVTDRIGVRGDVRYIQSFQDRAPTWTRGINFDVAPGHFNYLRASFGLTVRLGQINP